MNIYKGNMSNLRIGTKGFNKYGSVMEVIVYNNYDDIWVEFEKGNKVHTHWDAFKHGRVRNVYDKSVYGVGYIGEGYYKVMRDSKYTNQYVTWKGILERSYSERHKIRFPTYIGCSVAEEWHNFQNFAKWHDENFYQIEGDLMCLDKDILIKGNKKYSPETSVFVPMRINNLVVKKDASRGNLPIGVSEYKDRRKKKYGVKCSNGGGNEVSLGYYHTPQEAFLVYKDYKEKLIKNVAENYKEKIPYNLYEALLRYEVEISD